MSRSDKAIGITLGIAIGIAALILFVFLGSGNSIDAPSIDTKPPVEQPNDNGGAP